jgi:hypothetical protein
MLDPKGFLLVECQNVEQILQESLRYRYSEDVAAKYYTECFARLGSIVNGIKSVPMDEPDLLQDWREQLGTLSVLITHIERSHLEEFPWPFAFELERVAHDICAHYARTKDVLFFFMADGSPISYAVRGDEFLTVRRSKIYSVFFPRTLKDYVLLHAIFGHEVGHVISLAAGASEKKGSEISDVEMDLFADSRFATIDGFYEWCRANIGVLSKASDSYLKENLKSWRREIFSDLFGLLMMGPSFLYAFQSLLAPMYAPDQKLAFVPRHPPYPLRMVILHQAAEYLKMFYGDEGGDAAKLFRKLDKEFRATAKPFLNSEFAVVRDDKIHAAVSSLQKLMEKYDKPSVLYQRPENALLSELIKSLKKHIPPVGPKQINGDGSLQPLQLVDFRSIIHAGWITWAQRSADNKNDDLDDVSENVSESERFRTLNRFCAHAIMQQGGIRRLLDYQLKEERKNNQ